MLGAQPTKNDKLSQQKAFCLISLNINDKLGIDKKDYD